MITVFIVDDEAPARDELQYLLQDFAGTQVLGFAKNGREALVNIPELKPQVVFLDIQMPGHDRNCCSQGVGKPHGQRTFALADFCHGF